MTHSLSLATLDQLPASIARPAYRREAITPGIVHFGVGNFHRAHQALYLDTLMNQGLALDWGIIGAGVMPSDERMRQCLMKQDYLSTLVEQEADHNELRVIGSMIDFVKPGDSLSLFRWLEDPSIRIVSLTVTEGGYFLDAAGGLSLSQPEIMQDVETPHDPRTVFGLLVEGLRRRRAKGTIPFTIMCCDNIPHNGDVTRKVVTALARQTDAELAHWISEQVAFPNAMVDRITPATTDRQRDWLRQTHGVEDGWPVFCERFHQWVLEDKFPAGRPPFERAGVTLAEDVTPYETMKIRILNGGHALLAYPAALLDIHFVHEAMEHPLVSGFLDAVEQREVIPHVAPVPDTDLGDYLTSIKQRFGNPKIGDTIARLCQDGSSRQPKFILPIVRDRLVAGGNIDGLALGCALWCRYCAGRTESGQAITPNDGQWATLSQKAQQAVNDPAAWTGQSAIYGDLSADTAFRQAFGFWLKELLDNGVEKSLTAYIQNR